MTTQCVGHKIVYRGAHLRQSTSSSPNFQLLQLNGLARTPATEHACMNKGTHFSTGPTTSSRHSNTTLVYRNY